jgi:hypothetical protein
MASCRGPIDDSLEPWLCQGALLDQDAFFGAELLGQGHSYSGDVGCRLRCRLPVGPPHVTGSLTVAIGDTDYLSPVEWTVIS